ncbi:UNVERIFIED_CONTAM: hypothetical protein FKN15_007614 [Acipenser sinensis]
MSLSVRPTRRITSSSINRSQSFAGVNSSDKHYRSGGVPDSATERSDQCHHQWTNLVLFFVCLLLLLCRNRAVFSTPTSSRKSPSRASRMFTLSHKSLPPKVPQPERLDEVYEALKRGLQTYLQVHQLELDSLTRQMRESKRNSRLGFLYELDKQVKAIERFMRRLEFHLSKVTARNRAVFSTPTSSRKSPSRASRMFTLSHKSLPPKVPQPERLDEVYEALKRGLQTYLQVHQLELDSLTRQMRESKRNSRLGFLYELDKQVKAIERFMRRLEFHLSKIDELYEAYCMHRRLRDGANKMVKAYTAGSPGSREARESLAEANKGYKEYTEVTELKSLANHVVVGNVCCETKDLFAALPQTVAVDINDLGTIKLSLEVTWNPFDKDDQSSAASTVNKTTTVNKSPFDKDDQSSAASTVNKTTTVNKRFSTYNQSPPDTPSLREQAFYSSDDSSSPQLPVNQRHAQKTVVQPEIQAAAPIIEISFAPKEEPASAGDPASQEEEPCKEDREKSEEVVSNGHVRYLRSLSHISEASVDAVIVESICMETVAMEAVAEATVSFDAISVDDIVMEVPSTPERVEKTPDLKEQETQQRATDCQSTQRQGLCRSRASSISLTVEHVLESFDFLNTHDLEDSVSGSSDEEREREEEEEEEEEGVRASRPDSLQQGSGVPGEVLSEEIGLLGDSDVSPDHMSTGSKHLDRALVVHLDNCSHLLLQLGTFGPLRCREMYALDKLLREARVLGLVCKVSEEKSGVVNSAEEVLPFLESKHKALAFWSQCTEPLNVYTMTAERFMQSLHSVFSARLHDQHASRADTVFVKLAERVLEKRLPKRGRSGRQELITLFQYWSHLEEEGVSTLDTYITELAEQVSLIQSLQSGDQDTVLKTLKRVPETQLQKEGLRALSLLLLDKRIKVSNAASALLRSVADSPRSRERAKESIDQLVYLCQTDKDDVREAAKQALLSFVLPFLESKHKALAFWSQCTEPLNVYTMTAERFMQSLHSVFSARLHDQHASRADTVFVKLAERVLEKRLPKRGRSGRQELITLFQYWSHLEEEGVSTLDTYITELAEQVPCSDELQYRSGPSEALLRACSRNTCQAKESIDQLVYLCQTDKDDVREAAKQALLSFGEEGKLAQRHAEDSQDGLPRLFAPGSMASTAF